MNPVSQTNNTDNTFLLTNNSAPKRILIAEDNPVNRLITRAQIEKLGYQVDVVSNGLEAVEAVLGKDYALVFMDCQMPEMDGYKATSAIRQSEKNSQIPIIALTVDASNAEREMCLAVGMNDHLAKPISKTELGRVIEKWLNPVAETVSPETPLIDFERLNDISNGDAEMTDDLVGLYFEQIVDSFEKLEIAIAQKDFLAIKQIAHKAKGGSATCGMTTIVPVFKELEVVALEENQAAAAEKLALAREIYQQIQNYWQANKNSFY